MNKNTRYDFITDYEKMRDFRNLSKEEFLTSYSYLTPMEYDATVTREKELLYAIKVALAIIEDEDFVLEVSEVDADELGTTNALVFNLVDEQRANLGDIEDDYFDNLNGVLDRMEIYHNDYLYDDLETRLRNNEIVLQDDFARRLIIFLQSDYCFNLLNDATPSLYSDYVPTGFGFTFKNRLDEINLDEAIDYLIDKSIANKLMETLSAYTMIEIDNKVYLSCYGFADDYQNANISPEQALYSKIISPDYINADGSTKEDDYSVYDTHSDLISSQLPQIYEDIEDLGLDDFYLTDYELQYLGYEELQMVYVNGELIVEENYQELPIKVAQVVENLKNNYKQLDTWAEKSQGVIETIDNYKVEVKMDVFIDNTKMDILLHRLFQEEKTNDEIEY